MTPPPPPHPNVLTLFTLTYILYISNSVFLFSDIAQYHTHRGTLHVKSFDQDGHISTLYAGHSITLTHDTGTWWT